MSAQYRPYRDEESVDGLEAAWSDNEPGSVQIYEKTTEDLPFSSASKRILWLQIALLSTVGLLGFLLGYFAPFHPTAPISISLNPEDSDPKAVEHFESYFSKEDSSIKDKLLYRIEGDNILALLKKYDNTNRVPGSDSDQKLANEFQKAFSDFGFDHVSSEVNNFNTMMPRKSSVVKLLNKINQTIFANINNEKSEHDDIRPFLPLSQGNTTKVTTSELMYVNRGSKDDYKWLSDQGLNNTTGKILVVRLGFYQAYDVVITAQETGAAAVLVFPDPDVFGSKSPFPQLAQLPDDAERSHPTAWSNYGDLISNNSAIAGIDFSKLGFERETKVQIPVIPISFNTAKVILRGLSGHQAPVEWNCFEFTLYVGPGYKDDGTNSDDRDKISLDFFNQESTIKSSTVTGIIKGSAEPDRYVVIGSRRDSLTRGLLDSVSGSAVMMEIARVFGNLLKEGWRPRRTIIFNSFGAESLNLIGSSNWLELHQRLLNLRAVAYINCDLVVTGNNSVTIAASPLLYQVLFNATKQVENPNDHQVFKTVYDAWKEARKPTSGRRQTDMNLEKFLNDLETKEHYHASEVEKANGYDDRIGSPGSVLHEYRKSADVKARPKVRRLDLHSIYSPFLMYAGVPVVDVRYAGFSNMQSENDSSLLEDTLPLLGTRYDNLATVRKIDPRMKYHVAVAQVIAEILRDLSDSVFLPFNLFDYAVTLQDSFANLVDRYGSVFNSTFPMDLESLKSIIQDFTKAAARFHLLQDQVDPRDALRVRQLNDQLMSVERAFLDLSGVPNYGEKKHIILAPNDGQENFNAFPGLLDWLTTLDSAVLGDDDVFLLHEILKIHFKALVYTISNGIKIIDEVHTLSTSVDNEKHVDSGNKSSWKSPQKDKQSVN